MNVFDRSESFWAYVRARKGTVRRIMPYKVLEELPEPVRMHLPYHAQEVYMAAFNNSWEKYNHDEERAHRVAWAAVRHSYEKDELTGQWHAKQATYP